jgi:hypothetical protein
VTQRTELAKILLVFLVTLCLYTATLLPDVLPADAGEFQLVATTAGVAHPPGYPLYTMLGWFSTQLPLGPSPAFRVNLLSAVISAATVALVFRAGQRLTGTGWGGLVAALAIGSATTFWATATQASIRPLVAFFTALCLDNLIAFGIEPVERRDRFLVIFAASLSLGLTHHLSLASVGLVSAIFLLFIDPGLVRNPHRWLRPLLAILPGLVVLLYLPLRGAAGAVQAPSDLDTLSGFLEHVLGQGFRGDMFAFATAQQLPSRLSLLPTLLRFQFNPALLIAAGLGSLWLLWRERKLALLLLGTFVLHTFLVLTYRAPQTVEYEMPAYVALAILAAAPIHALRDRQLVARTLMIVLLIGAGAANLASHLPSYVALTELEDTRAIAEPILADAPQNALILSDWHWVTPMRYLQYVEGVRPDLTIRYVYPIPGRDYAQVWLELIENAAPGTSVVVTHRFAEVEAVGHTLSPLGSAFLVDQDRDIAVSNTVEVELGEQLVLLGTDTLPSEGSAGTPLEVFLAWEQIAPQDNDLSVFVHLLGPDGRLWGQGRDHTYPVGSLGESSQQVERFVVTPFLHAPPGQYTLVAGAYQPQPDGWTRLTTDDGADLVTLGSVLLNPRRYPPASQHPFLLPRPVGSDLALVGVDYDCSVPGQLRVYLHWRGPSAGEAIQLQYSDAPALQSSLPHSEEPGYFTTVYDLPAGSRTVSVAVGGRTVRLANPSSEDLYVPLGGEVALVGLDKPDLPLPAGSEATVTFHFLALRPLHYDRHVTSRLVGDTYAWWSQEDGTPALGGIPTFKWVSGSQVADRRTLAIPADAGAGQATLYVGLYDAFSGEPLSVLDERYSEYAGSLPITTLTISTP